MMLTLQWLGFAGIVAGTWFYGSRPFVGASLAAAGAAPLAAWSLLLDPPGYGSFCVQAVCMVLSTRNALRFWRIKHG